MTSTDFTTGNGVRYFTLTLDWQEVHPITGLLYVYDSCSDVIDGRAALWAALERHGVGHLHGRTDTGRIAPQSVGGPVVRWEPDHAKNMYATLATR